MDSDPARHAKNKADNFPEDSAAKGPSAAAFFTF